jgi:hypothetical protein
MKNRIKVILISAFLIIGGAHLLHRQHVPPPSKTDEPMEWQEFICKDGGFSLQVPGTPTPLNQPESLLLKMANFKPSGLSVEREEARFYVYYADSPVVDPKDQDEWLETTFTLTRMMKKGKFDFKRIQFQGSPGREATLDLDENHFVEVARTYFVNNRFYQIGVITSKDRVRADYITKYLDSFRLVNP